MTTDSKEMLWKTRNELMQELGIALRTFQRRVEKGQIVVNNSDRKQPTFMVAKAPTLSPVLEDKPKFAPATVTDTSYALNLIENINNMKNSKSINLVHSPAIIQDMKRTKIVSLSDLHCPFQNDELIDSIVKEHSGAEYCVLNGDILDLYSLSSYSKTRPIVFQTEYHSALKLLIKLSEHFGTIKLVKGNHDDRSERFLTSRLDPLTLSVTDKDIFAKLANGHIIDDQGAVVASYKFDNVTYDVSGPQWLTKVGQTIFMHPHSFSSGPMATILKGLEHLTNFQPYDSFDSVVMGHTHKVGKIIFKSKLLIEQGCLTRVQDYQKGGVFQKNPSTLGYALIYQDGKGNTDFNQSNFVYCGTLNHLIS
jgi:predicted phosphodiesterase